MRPLLRESGHGVFTPSLTGLGGRAHLARPDVDLDTHIDGVAAVLTFEDLREVILVGHSYGGPVITGTADRVPDRVAQLVYLDAAVARHGESEMDLLPAEERLAYQQSARLHGDGWRIRPPIPNPLPAGLDPDVHWAMTRMVPQPLGTFTQPLRLNNPSPRHRRTYVLHTEGKTGEPPDYVRRVRADPDGRFQELAADHAAHVTAPRQVTELLVTLA